MEDLEHGGNIFQYPMTTRIPRSTPLPPRFTRSHLLTKVGYGSCRFLVKPPTCILVHLLLSGPLVPTRSTEWVCLYTSPVRRVSSSRDFDTDLQVFPVVHSCQRQMQVPIYVCVYLAIVVVRIHRQNSARLNGRDREHRGIQLPRQLHQLYVYGGTCTTVRFTIYNKDQVGCP